MDGGTTTLPPAAPPRRRRRFRLRVFVALLVAFYLLFASHGVAGLLGLSVHTQLPDLSRPGHYSFEKVQPGTHVPVSYDPCHSLHVVLNPAGGPSNAQDLLLQAIAKVSAASGLPIVYDGVSASRPNWTGSNVSVVPGPAPPVLVAFADDHEVPRLAGDVAGIGGSAAMPMGNGQERYVTGQVSLDKGTFADLHGRRNGDLEARAIIMHELGHVVGLGHVDDSNELMYRKNVGLVDFGPGDLRGLKVLGHGSCF